MKWRDIPKIDAHIHIIPDEVHAANPDSDAGLLSSIDIASSVALYMDIFGP